MAAVGKLVATSLEAFAAPECSLTASFSSCSTRIASPLSDAGSNASSRPSSACSNSSLPSVTMFEAPVRSRPASRPMSRSSSSSSLTTPASCKLPALLLSTEADSSQKMVHRNVRRSSSVVTGKAPLVRRKALPEFSGVSDKVPLVRRKTLPESSEKISSTKQARSHSHSGLTLRSKGSKKEAVPNEDAQAQAIKALAVHMAAKKSFEGAAATKVVDAVCRYVMKHDGSRAFPQEHMNEAVDFVLSGGDAEVSLCSTPVAWVDRESKVGIGPLMVPVLRELVRGADLSFSDAAGQILWHFRKSEALKDSLLHMTAKDLSWVDFAPMPHTSMRVKPNELVENVFKVHSDADNRLEERSFLRIMDRALHEYMILENGVTQYTGSKASIRRTDLDQLFYSQAHYSGHSGLTCQGFKSVLVKLAENMGVHPASMFFTVGNMGQ